MQRELRIELGRVWMAADDAAGLDVGSQVELDSLADEAVTMRCAGRPVATGVLAVMDDRLCVRVLETARAVAGLSPAAGHLPSSPAPAAS
jgi:flagellar motor switch/type III secretory pathway protein FliN